MKLIQNLIKPVAIVVMIYSILYYYCDVLPARAATREDIYPIDVLYSQPFNEDILNTYQVKTNTEVNVRKGPGRKYDIYKSIPENEPVDVIIEEYPETGWIKVWVDCGDYFVCTKYLRVIKRNIYE